MRTKQDDVKVLAEAYNKVYKATKTIRETNFNRNNQKVSLQDILDLLYESESESKLNYILLDKVINGQMSKEDFIDYLGVTQGEVAKNLEMAINDEYM